MLKVKIFIFLSFISFSSTALATNYYVSNNGNNGNDGLGWGASHALLTITEAITRANATPEVDTIHVAEGTYDEWDLTLGSDLTLYGGYPTGGGTRDPNSNITTIDGNSNATVIFCYNISNVTIDGDMKVTFQASEKFMPKKDDKKK